MNNTAVTVKCRIVIAAIAVSLMFLSCSDVLSRSKTPAKSVPVESFTGMVEHVFFHPLIIFPDNAFSKSHKGGYMSDWFVTLSEFNLFLDDLYQRGYVLVSMKDLYELKNGIPVKKILLFNSTSYLTPLSCTLANFMACLSLFFYELVSGYRIMRTRHSTDF